MQDARINDRMTTKLVDSLYIEAMILADETRAYFDEPGRADRDALPPARRVTFSCESLKVTTRLMHVIAWLLTRRAIEAGELSVHQGREPARRLGTAADSDESAIGILPAPARLLVEASLDLYGRIQRLDQEIDRPVFAPSPARGLLRRLEQTF